AAFFGEEGLVIVASVYRVVVQQAGNSAKADQAKSGVWHRSGRQKGEIRPAPPVDRQPVDGRLVDVGSEFFGLSIDRRCASDDFDGGRRRADAQYCVNAAQTSDLDHELLLFVFGKAGGGDGQCVCAGLKVVESEPAIAVGGRGLRLIGVRALQCD